MSSLNDTKMIACVFSRFLSHKRDQQPNIWGYLYSQSYTFIDFCTHSHLSTYRLLLQLYPHTVPTVKPHSESHSFGLWLQMRLLFISHFSVMVRYTTLVLPQLLHPASNLYDLFHPHLRTTSLPRRWAHTLQNPLQLRPLSQNDLLSICSRNWPH